MCISNIGTDQLADWKVLQLLISVLSPFPTPNLLPLALVSRRFHALVLRLLHHRLSRATTLPGHSLILECYHPSVRLTTPYLLCDYRGTDGLDYPSALDGAACATEQDSYLSLAGMRQAYSHFRPVPQENNRRARQRYPLRSPTAYAHSGPGERGSPGAQHAELESHDVYLDEDESFTQLCTITNLMRVESGGGRFLSHMNVGDGVVRVWRDWLAAQAAAVTGKEKGADSKDNILWADHHRHVGLRFRVSEKMDAHRPLLVAQHEDPAVSYCLQYEGRYSSRGNY